MNFHQCKKPFLCSCMVEDLSEKTSDRMMEIVKERFNETDMKKPNITAEEVKQAMINNNIIKVDCHKCSFCNYMTNYNRRGDNIYFDAGCNCTGRYNNELRSFQDVADWINMQPNNEAKLKLANKFGIEKAGYDL